MKYRIFESNGKFAVQRKKFLCKWVWYCGGIFGWSNYWGEKEKCALSNRERFYSLDEALDFIAKEKYGLDDGVLITSENIHEYIELSHD